MRTETESAVEAATDYERNAVFFSPLTTTDRGLRQISTRAFLAERDRALDADTPICFVPLDNSEQLGTPWPATTPFMLARYVVLEAGKAFRHRLDSSGEIYYVIRGQGESRSGTHALNWSSGDCFVLPSGNETTHLAEQRALLLQVTDEPLLRFLGVPTPPLDAPVLDPALFTCRRIEEELAAVHARGAEHQNPGKTVILTTLPQYATRTALPSVLVAINTLEPGDDQAPHVHNAAALTLAVEHEDVHSMIDGQRHDWQEHAVLLTPPGSPHSHHSRGAGRMKAFVVQDSGLFHQARVTGFRYV